MNEFMKVALELADANLSSNEGGPFGACIVKNGKVIGKGNNQVLSKCDPTLHAEIVAIKSACKTLESHDLSGCILYTTSYPCPMCLSAIMWANIKTVYYGNNKEDTKKLGFRDADMYDFIEKLNKGFCDSSILELNSLDREFTIKEYEEFMKKSDKILY